MEDNQKLKALHESLLKDNYELPSYEVFAEDLRSPEKSKAFYEGLVKDNYELPDYEVFVNDLGLKKKDYFFGRDLVKELYGEESPDGSKESAPEVSKKPSPSELANFKFAEPKDAVKKAFQSSLPEPADLTTPDLSLKQTDGKFSFPQNDLNHSLARAMLDIPIKEDEPEPKNIDYVTALPKGFNERAAQAIRVVGNALSSPVESVAYVAEKASGKKDSQAEQYLRQAFSQLPILGAFTTENYEQLAQLVEKAGRPGEAPNNLLGKTLESTGSILFDLMAIKTPPTPKIATLAKYGMERVPMFPAYLGVMEGGLAAQQGKSLKETAGATLSGVSNGLTYEGMGVIAGRVGQLVKELGGGQTLSTTSRALVNSALFGADSKMKGGTFTEGAVMGALFGGYDLTMEGINRSMAHRAYVSYLTATDNNIRTISKMQVDPMKLRKQSDELWTQYEAIEAPKPSNKDIKEALDRSRIELEGIDRMLKNPEFKDIHEELNKERELLLSDPVAYWDWKSKTDLSEPEIDLPWITKTLETSKYLQKQHLLEEKTAVDNIININAMTQEILKNPKAFTDAIAKDERLSPKEKALWTNKINTTVKDADPRLAEAEPIVADIKQKEGELAYWQENESVDPMIKDAKVESVTTQIEEQNKALQNTLAKPLEDYAPKKERGKTTDEKPEAKDEIPDRIKEIEKIARDEGYTFEVDADLDPDFTSLTFYDSGKNPVEYSKLPKGIKELADEYTQLMHKDQVSTDVPESKLAVGDKKFQTKEELNTYLEDIAVNKKTGEVDETWFDREVNAWPTPETVKAINEWTENKKAEIKAKKKPVKEEPIETGLTKVEQKELDKNGLIDEIRRFNILSASGRKKAAMQANTIRVNAKRLGYELKEGGDEWKVGVVKDGKFLSIKKDPTKVDKAKVESQQLLSEKDQDFQDYVKEVFETNPDLYGVMIGGLTNEQRAQAFRDIQAGRKTTASASALNELERMYKDSGGIDIWNAEGKMRVGVSREEIRAEIEDMKRRKRDELFSTYDLDEALNKGLITKTEYDEIRESERKQDIESRAAEEDFYRDEAGDIEGSKEKRTEGELTPKVNEQPVKQPDITTGKEGENIVPTGTEKGVAGVEGQGTKEPVSEPAKVETPKATENTLNDAVSKYGWSAVKNPEGFWLLNPKGTAVVKVKIKKGTYQFFDTADKKLMDGRGQLEKSAEKLLKDYYYAKEVKAEPVKAETPIVEKTAEIPQGIKFKDKNYTDIDQVQDDLAEGKITFDESKKLMEDVRQFEDNLKVEADRKAQQAGERMNVVSQEAEQRMLDELNPDKGKLYSRLIPPIIERGSTSLWNQLRHARDAGANWVAKTLGEGLKSQNDLLRWNTKALTNLYNGLARSQADIHGRKKGDVGKLAMTGTVKVYAAHEGQELYGKLKEMVHGDPESAARVWSLLDPEMSAKPGETPLTYGDLTLAEKNLYHTAREWINWGHETNYAAGFLPTETYLKNKDATGNSTYIARMYDTHEIDGTMEGLAKNGKGGVSIRLITDYMKARKEVDDWKKEHAIKDPAYLVAKRVMQTIQNVAVARYQDLVMREHPDFVLTLKAGQEVPKGYTKLGSSYAWGRFRNKAVIDHVVEDFTGYYFANQKVNMMYDWMKMVDQSGVNQFYKKYRTVFNPFVQTGNISGNLFFASINGLNPISFAGKMIQYRNFHKTHPPIFKALMKSGLIGDFGITGDMKPLVQGDVAEQASPTGIKKLLKNVDEFATNFYSGADNVAKIAAYMTYREHGLSHELAVRRAYDAFQNYATVGKTWDFTSKIPGIGPTFVKFQADLQRILVNNMLTTPLTTIGTVALIKLFGDLTSRLSGETDEEKEVREGRKGVPKIPIVDIPLSFKMGNTEVNFAKYLTPFYLYPQGDSEMDVYDFSKFAPIQLQKPKGGSAIPLPAFADASWGWLGSVLADRDFRNISIQDPIKTNYTDVNISNWERFSNVMHYVARSQVPFYKGTEDMIKGMTGQLDYYGRKREWWQAITNNIIKTQQFGDTELKNYMERQIDYLTQRFASLSENMGDANSQFIKAIKKAEDMGLEGDALQKVYDKEDKLRSQRMQKSLDEQVPVMQELERITKVYKGWDPNNQFIQENFLDIEAGKNRRFNVQNDVDLQKQYPYEYKLLKKHDLLKKPYEVPDKMGDVRLTEDQKKQFISIYWSEYIKLLDLQVGLTEEEFAKLESLQLGETLDYEEGKIPKTSLDMASKNAYKMAMAAADNQLRISIKLNK